MSQSLSLEDPKAGLMRMAVDILTTVYRTLASQGTEMSHSTFDTLRATYVRVAQNCVRQYAADAIVNDLEFNRHQEELVIDAFASCITKAAEVYRNDPGGAQAIPNWTRVRAAFPELTERLRDSV